MLLLLIYTHRCTRECLRHSFPPTITVLHLHDFTAAKTSRRRAAAAAAKRERGTTERGTFRLTRIDGATRGRHRPCPCRRRASCLRRRRRWWGCTASSFSTTRGTCLIIFPCPMSRTLAKATLRIAPAARACPWACFRFRLYNIASSLFTPSCCYITSNRRLC